MEELRVIRVSPTRLYDPETGTTISVRRRRRRIRTYTEPLTPAERRAYREAGMMTMTVVEPRRGPGRPPGSGSLGGTRVTYQYRPDPLYAKLRRARRAMEEARAAWREAIDIIAGEREKRAVTIHDPETGLPIKTTYVETGERRGGIAGTLGAIRKHFYRKEQLSREEIRELFKEEFGRAPSREEMRRAMEEFGKPQYRGLLPWIKRRLYRKTIEPETGEVVKKGLLPVLWQWGERRKPELEELYAAKGRRKQVLKEIAKKWIRKEGPTFTGTPSVAAETVTKLEEEMPLTPEEYERKLRATIRRQLKFEEATKDVPPQYKAAVEEGEWSIIKDLPPQWRPSHPPPGWTYEELTESEKLLKRIEEEERAKREAQKAVKALVFIHPTTGKEYPLPPKIQRRVERYIAEGVLTPAEVQESMIYTGGEYSTFIPGPALEKKIDAWRRSRRKQVEREAMERPAIEAEKEYWKKMSQMKAEEEKAAAEKRLKEFEKRYEAEKGFDAAVARMYADIEARKRPQEKVVIGNIKSAYEEIPLVDAPGIDIPKTRREVEKEIKREILRGTPIERAKEGLKVEKERWEKIYRDAGISLERPKVEREAPELREALIGESRPTAREHKPEVVERIKQLFGKKEGSGGRVRLHRKDSMLNQAIKSIPRIEIPKAYWVPSEQKLRNFGYSIFDDNLLLFNRYMLAANNGIKRARGQISNKDIFTQAINIWDGGRVRKRSSLSIEMPKLPKLMEMPKLQKIESIGMPKLSRLDNALMPLPPLMEPNGGRVIKRKEKFDYGDWLSLSRNETFSFKVPKDVFSLRPLSRNETFSFKVPKDVGSRLFGKAGKKKQRQPVFNDWMQVPGIKNKSRSKQSIFNDWLKVPKQPSLRSQKIGKRIQDKDIFSLKGTMKELNAITTKHSKGGKIPGNEWFGMGALIPLGGRTGGKRKKEWKYNPWAICTVTVGRKDKAKFERCVKAVKKQQGGRIGGGSIFNFNDWLKPIPARSSSRRKNKTPKNIFDVRIPKFKMPKMKGWY